MAALAASACIIIPSDGDASDGGAAPPGDGGGGAAVDAGADEGDGTCDPAPGSTTGKKIRVVYLVPSDRQEDPRYTASLEQSLRTVQLWLRARTPQGTSFRVHDPAVEVVKSEHPEAYYNSNDTGRPDLLYWDNTLADAFAATGADFDDPDNVWLIYVDVAAGCGQRTGTAGHVALFPRNDLLGLVAEPRVKVCPDDPDESYGRCRWVGGMALLMMNALGVPAPAACTDEDEATKCPDDNISRRGYLSFPQAGLEPEQLSYLDGTGFANAIGLPDCELDCNAVPEP